MKAFALAWCMMLAGTFAFAANPLGLTQNCFPTPLPVPKDAAVSLKVPATAKIGDDLQSEFIVTNTGDQTFEISTGGDYRATGYPLRLKVRVTDSTGNVLPDATKDALDMGGMLAPHKIEPKKSHSITFPLSAYASFLEPGVYSIEACHDLGWLVQDEHPHPIAKTSISITMPTDEEAAARVHELCVGEDPEYKSTLQIERLRHPIFLPALVAEGRAGSARAAKALAAIPTAEANAALLEFAQSSFIEVARMAGRGLYFRVPVLEDSLTSAIGSLNYGVGRADRIKAWQPALRGPLLAGAVKMLESEDKEVVDCGASFIARQGGADQARPLLVAMQRALDVWQEPRTGRLGQFVNVLNPPTPLPGCIAALDALRARGWRTDGMGSTAALIALFRQLADPKMPRPTDDLWKQLVHAYITQNPATLRQNALLTILQPMAAEWEKDVLTALEDEDWGVLRTACEVAGRSGRKRFVPALAQILETVPETFVRSTASGALDLLGAKADGMRAWCEVITDQYATVDAIGKLIRGAIVLPESHLSSGNSRFTREQRFAMRDAWRAFLTQHRARLEAGERMPPDHPSVTPLLTGAQFHPDNPAVVIHFDDGTTWPRVQKQSR